MSARRFWLAAALSLLALPAWAQKADIILVYRPDVDLNSPLNGAQYVVGQNVYMEAFGTPMTGDITAMDLYLDGALYAHETTSAMVTANWTATLGTHTITAKATDQASSRTTSPITITVSANTPPTVSLTAPSSGASYTVGATVALTATASDSDGTISKVEFYVDSEKVGQATSSPYTYNWTGTAGDHSVYAKATDNATGSTSTSPITIHGKPAVPTLTLPSTSTTGSYTASWTTSSGTTHYELSEQIGSGSWIPVQDNGTTSWNASGKTDGSYSYRVRACAGSGTGNCSAYSSTKSITVTLPNIPPSISLTSPADGTSYTVGATVALTATASDSDGTINKVEFYVDSSKVGQATSSPYTYNWTATAGDHSVYAKATDNDNASTSTSPPITIHVKPGPPTLTLPGTSSTGSYTASWTTSTGATHYELSEKIGSGSWIPVQDDGTTSWNASGKADGSYSYRVRACAGSGTGNCSSYSSTKTITVTNAPTPPPTPTLTVPSTSSTGSYTASWTTSTGATHYDLSEQVGSGSWTSIQNTSATSRNISGKTTGSYSYRVRACTGSSADMTNCSSDSLTKTIAVTIPSLSITRTYTYNSYQELCRVVEPEVGPAESTEGGATLMGYDAAGNLAWSASGLAATTACSSTGSGVDRKVTRTYDARNRVSTLVFPDLNGNQEWHYTPDGLPSSVTTTNIEASVANSVVNTYSYNKRRMLVGESQTSGSNTWSVGYGYDGNAHLSTLEYPDDLTSGNRTLAYAPNALGQPTQVVGGTQTFASSVTYFPNGAIAGFTYGNGIVHSLTQNARGLPDRSRDADGSTSIHDDSYFYDEVGNVAAIADGVSGARGDRDMTYDALNRLTLVTGADGAPSPMFGTASYTYDVLDNLKHVHVTAGAQLRDQEYFYDAHNRLTNLIEDGESVIGLDYDVQGNLSNKNGTTYTFDYGNRMRAGGPETYRYDVQGRRIRSSSTAGVIYSLYAQSGQLLFQRDERSSKRRQYIYLGGSLVAESDLPLTGGTATVTYQHTDALGSPVAITSSSKVVLERREYEPYGYQLTPTLQDGPNYTGHVADAATGLVYMQQRYMDPLIGRFLSVDPITVEPATGSNFNRYSYANNNSYYFVDKDGRKGRHFCDNPAFPCDDNSFTNGDAPQNFHAMAKVGAAGGAVLGAVAAAGCDLASGGICVLSNPVLIGGGAALGAVAGEGLDRAWVQLGKLIEKSLNDSGGMEYQYALRARQDGLYPDVRNGTVRLKAGDVWKYGTSVEPGKRYPAAALQTLGLTMEVQSMGNPYQVLAQEKIQLINYVIRNGDLPPGNKIYK